MNLFVLTEAPGVALKGTTYFANDFPAHSLIVTCLDVGPQLLQTCQRSGLTVSNDAIKSFLSSVLLFVFLTVSRHKVKMSAKLAMETGHVLLGMLPSHVIIQVAG